MSATYVFAGMAVLDYESARGWYERLLGRPADLLPNDNEAAWRLTDTGWIYIVGDAERCGSSLLTVLVDDLDERVAGIAERGVAPGAVEVMPGIARRVVITDPDGNSLTLAQPLSLA
jgi:predicted enzyme related to lactoylglutathione lyase